MVQEAAESWGEGKGRIIQAGEAGYAKVLNGSQGRGGTKKALGVQSRAEKGWGCGTKGLDLTPSLINYCFCDVR